VRTGLRIRHRSPPRLGFGRLADSARPRRRLSYRA
jgi:hypothetical protein